MTRQILEIAFLACVVVGCYMIYPPLAYIVSGIAGLVWLAMNGGRSNGITR